MCKNTFNYSTIAYISLGSNTGDSSQLLQSALHELAELPQTRLLKSSSVYRTEPQGDPNQPWFFNQVTALDTDLAPEVLLTCLQAVENSLGRRRDPARRFGPRSMDLDILLYGDLVMHSPNLILPHPRMFERAFVLVPLQEIAAEPLKTTLAAALGNLNYVLNGDMIFQACI